MSVQIRVLERDRTFTPLGIRFWDAALDLPVAAALDVYAWRDGAASAPVRAVRSPSGVYAFHRLPGQLRAEKPRGDDERPEVDGPAGEYVIAVDDRAGRFLGAAFRVTLPLGYRGEFLSGGPASPPASGGRAYLFPSPARPVPPGLAAVRAELVDRDTGAPAAWAVLEATLAGETATAIADEAGRAVLMLPWPTPDLLRHPSPPVDAGTATWTITLSVRWEPGALRYPFPARDDLPDAWTARPSLKSILEAQGPAEVWTDEEDPSVESWTETLVHGQELVLRTRLADGGHAPTVRISGAASPP